MSTIIFQTSLRIRIKDGKDIPVQTVSARWADNDPSHAVAHNYDSHNAAATALRTFRYAAHQQGG